MKIRQHLTKICVGAILLASLAVLTLGPTGPMAGAMQAVPLATCTTTGTPTPCPIGTIPVVVTPGPFSSGAGGLVVNNNTPVTLSADDQNIPFQFPVTLSDARGTGTGWTITASSTALAFTAIGISSDPTLLAVNVTCVIRSTCANPSAIPTGAAGTDLVTGPATIASAGTGQGLGSYSIITYGTISYPGGGGAPTGGGDLSVTVAQVP